MTALPPPSLLDRLLDDGPADALADDELFDQLLTGLRRDLEDLLNGRQRCRSWDRHDGELATSLINFGIPDFTARIFDSHDSRDRFRREIETAIRAFEPRLKTVRVDLRDPANVEDRTLHLRVLGTIRVDGEDAVFAFDSAVDAVSRRFALDGGGDD